MPAVATQLPALTKFYGAGALTYLKKTDLNLKQFSKDTGFDFVVQTFTGCISLAIIVPPQRQVVYYKPGKAYGHVGEAKPYWVPLPWMIYHVKILSNNSRPFQLWCFSMARTKPTVSTESWMIRRFPDPNVGCLGPGIWNVKSINEIFTHLIPRFWGMGFNNDNGVILPWFTKLAADRLGTSPEDAKDKCVYNNLRKAKYTEIGFEQWESLKWKQLQLDREQFEAYTSKGLWVKDRYPAYDLTL